MTRRRSFALAGFACAGLALTASATDTGPGGTVLTASDLNTGRTMAHAARFASGEVAVFGGHGDGFTPLDTVEILDPAAPQTGWTSVTLRHTRDLAYFARLADGRYLIAGGALAEAVPAHADAEIFDPVTRTSTATDDCVSARCGGTAATLTDGRVLLAGGWNDLSGASSTGEVFDPADHTDTPTGTFSVTGAMYEPRAYPTVVPTAGGGAIVLGGVHPVPGNEYALTSVESWDGPSRVFTEIRADLFATETGWEPDPGTSAYRAVDEQRIFDGRYLFTASHPGTAEQTLYTVSGATGLVERFAVTPDLPLSSDAVLVTALVDPTGETARLLLRDATGSAPFERFQFATVTLRTGELDRPTGWFVPPGDHAPVVGGATLADAGRILLAGGPDLSLPDGYHNSARALVVNDPAPPLLPPEAPTGVTAAVSGAVEIRVRWTDASTRETGWHVERAPAGGSVWQAMGDAPADATSFVNSGVTRDQAFKYRVASFNAAGASEWVETIVPAKIQAGKAVAPKKIAFGATRAGVAKRKKITITNSDKVATLMIGLTGVTGSFSVDLADPLLVAPKKRVTLTVTALAQAAGPQAGALTLWTSDAAKPACVISLTAKASPPRK